jgi:hypothetical protein
MRMLDEKRDESLSRIVILLTRAEAEDLRDSLESILDDGIGHHAHTPSEDYQKEITVAIYEEADQANVDSFNDRCRRLIREDS